MSKKILKIGILVSGRGSNMSAIIKACAKGRTSATVAVVVSDNPSAPALKKAEKAGIEFFSVPFQKGESKKDFEEKIAAILEGHGVELVVLAGFMRILSPYFVLKFPNRIINIHPSLLPAFPGLESQKQALCHGVRHAGCTVHFVDTDCDSGPIILQAVVPVKPSDTAESLSARILKKEHALLPKAIDLIAKNKVKVVGRKVEIS